MRLPRVGRILSVLSLLFVALGVAACSLARAKEREEPREHVASPTPPTALVPLERFAAPMRESAGLAMAMSRNGGGALAFLADADDRALVAFDAATLEKKMRVDLEGTPEQLIALPSGEIAVTLVDAGLL